MSTMIKHIAILGILILLSSQQTTVAPKTQKCECQNLLNQQDCASQLGCAWIPSNNTDTVNNTGSCASQNNTQTTNSSVTITQCSKIQNSTLCSKTIGCAYFNNTCVLFSGCSAYVQTTNSQCQAISSQCTTDSTRCVEPSPCPSYNTSSLCQGKKFHNLKHEDNIASSGAKSCKWVETGTQASCVDKVCSDAPNTYNTDLMCDGFIAGCLSTGQGCIANRQSCSKYLKEAGCTGMIGSDGPCTNNSDQGSNVCRPLTCMDAANTLSSNADCQNFLSGCLTTGKGCVKTLQSCSSYQQSQGCVGLIGSDGPCVVDSTSQTSCRAIACSDAPNSLNTNEACNQFLNNCVTNGQGCTKTLGLCSSYNGNESQCNLYIGSDGNCKATSSLSIQQCLVRTCGDATKTFNNDKDCNNYQKGCITNGAGCVVSLQLCQQYKGTATTCLLYKGIDGNCFAPSTQTTDGPCSVKVCSAATQNTNTNSGCQQYSYKCVTNGTTCIDSPTCEVTQQQITCEGNSACSYSQVCLDRSSCTNYSTQSQCSLNQQQYKLGSKTYLRKCQWSSSCQNTLCSSLPTTLKTDTDCDAALSGCITKGNGCVDLSDNCTAYSGLIQTCQGFKGLNGQQACTQLNTQTNPSTACVAITQCSQAKLYSSVTQISNTTCDAFLKGCYFDGNGGCTNGDCTTYFGTLTTCQNINTAISSNSPQKCWKVDQPTNQATACIPRTCDHAIVTASTPFNSDTLCQAFLSNCVWNGKSAGGCWDSSTACSSYLGTATSCAQFAQSGQKCTNTKGSACKLSSTTSSSTSTQKKTVCSQLVIPTEFLNTDDAYVYCQSFTDYYGNNCALGYKKCQDSISNSGCQQFMSIGNTNDDRKTSCQKLQYPNYAFCTYSTSSGNPLCSQSICTEIQAKGSTDQEKFNFCKSMTQQLSAYTLTCYWDLQSQNCLREDYCNQYQLPSKLTTLDDKVKYCSSLVYDSSPCTYKGSGTTCAGKIDNCYELTSADSDDNNNKIICSNSKKKSNLCKWTASGCDDNTCNNTVIDVDLYSNDARQDFCTSKLQGCGFDDQTTDKCWSPASPACSSYKTYQSSDTQNIKMCLRYIVSGIQCTYGSGTTCKDYDCGDVKSGWSDSICQTYHPKCQFDGLSCIKQELNCSDYVMQKDSSGNVTNCQNLKPLSGKFCVNGPTSSSKCKERECSDISTGGSDQICQNYLPYCVFNGTGCQLPGTCDSYAAFGTTPQDKSAFCNSKTPAGNGKCTYIAGATKCSQAQNQCTSYNVSGFSGSTSTIGCSLLIDNNGLACQFNSGATCSNGDCSGAPSTVNSDADCQSYKSICVLDSSPCSNISCASAPQSIQSDSACQSYRQGCITNGAGCIESSSNCSDFKGTASTCSNFKANKGSQLCGNTYSAVATDPCKNRSCDQNTTAKTDSDCDKWIPPTGNVKNCVWNGSNGCVSPQQCSKFQGTIDSCPKYTATDGPCKGANTSTSACSTYVCTEAPSTYNTDAQCKSWGPACMTNGAGCTPTGSCSNLTLPSVCSAYKNSLGCDLANQCKSKPQQCTDITLRIDCNYLSEPKCGWNQQTSSCGPLTCDTLPQSLTTDQSCSQALSTCTTTGSGCVTKGACSNYNKQACTVAATTDIQKSCIWQSSSSICRPIQCTDNTSATSDAACDNYLKGCKTTGSGCAQSLTCQQYTLSQLCILDSNGNPCLWFKTQQNLSGSCISYTKCSDIVSSSHQDCQNASPNCTTNGINCIAITSCSKTILQASCTIGTDGNCGWLTSSSGGYCALYTNCAAAKGTTTQQCKAWGKQCISDGVSCIETSTCSSYSTQQACSNSGTDGICFWQQAEGQTSQGTCRLQVCSDATTNNSTHSGCSSFIANTQCTTSGTGCIQLGTCQSYKSQAGCVVGTDGQCFWQQSQNNSTDSQCRLKQCTDNTLTTSQACLNSISGLKCVSDGVNCVKQGLCETYTTKEACLGGGTDGQCAFTPNSNTDQSKGKCQLFNSCQSASQDQQTCLTRQDSCYFNSTTINGTTTTSCQPHTCSTKAQASSCQPIPSFDLSSYQICVLAGTLCQSGSPTQLTSADCYINSIQTYTWSPTTQSCRACKSSSLVNNTNNQTNETRSDSQGFVLGLSFMIAIYSI